MGIPISATLLFLHLLGWTAPNVRNPVVRATVVDDRVLLPTYKSEGILTLVRGGPNLILDQPLHRAGPPVQLRLSFGQKDKLPPMIRPSTRLRIDRHNFYHVYFSPFALGENYDQHDNPQYLSYIPLDIIRFINKQDRHQSDETREAISKLVVGFQQPPMFAGEQFDYLPVKDGKFEWYYSGMMYEKFGGGVRRFSVMRWIKLPPLGDQKYRSEVSKWATPLANDWSEGFTVVGVEDDRFFVTSAGRLFMAPRAKPTGGALKLLPTELPIRVLIHDTDTDKHYAFTVATYFEIAETIRPRPHTLPISPPLTAASALRDGLKAIEVAARCARLVRGVPDPVAK
jgi:hypothetical protein